ncbi:transposase [Archangium sp.]|uniref:transposase n=1 Tax=Archangium sp. TaxID=1872627 RepID=UPI002D297CBB|nr:transposase [Archangium sp.]HYO58492.1 transposase [Archangium sp.]
MERLLRVVRHRVLRLLEKGGALPAQGSENALRAYQAHSPRQRLRWTELDVRPPPRKQPRCALMEGFSPHANTHLHAHDRQGLERLCRYGARGALALERLKRAEEGHITYRMKRPLPDGTTHLFFTGLELPRRVASLVPAPRANLTRFHGVFAPGARLRPFLFPQAGAQEASVVPEAAARREPKKERTPRVDQAELLRGTLDFDVLAYVRCGGRRVGIGGDCGAPGVAHAGGEVGRSATLRHGSFLRTQRGLSDFGALAHVVISIINLGKIDRQEPLLFYVEGLSDRTVIPLERMERRATGPAGAHAVPERAPRRGFRCLD